MKELAGGGRQFLGELVGESLGSADDGSSTIQPMSPKTPETPGAIRMRLTHLRDRKTVLDELICSLERYAVYELPVAKPQLKPQRRNVFKNGGDRRLAGAA